ncbi:MAG: TVP38/TMEM64 family protein [Muribaculaceae bacterium]|nr:TVP38/TMEM64 family protein [Muribaculaceae bacterium]
MNPKKRKHTLSRRQWIQLLLSVAALIFICIIGYGIGRPLIRFVSEPEQFQAWVQDKGFPGVLAFMGMVILQVFLAVIPGGPFEVGAGYAFGVVKGVLICDLATTIASLLVFLFVRRFGMKFVELFVSREQIESVHILKSSGKSESILFLLFLIPGTPKDLLSYLVGLTDMKVSHWIFICAIGRLPAILLSALSGQALENADYGIAGVLFAALLVLYITGLIVYRFHNRNVPKKQ